MMKLLTLLSGGIGSLVATKLMLDTHNVDELYCLFVNYGQKASTPEGWCARKQAKLLNTKQFVSISTAPLRGGTAVLDSGYTDGDCHECIPFLFEHLLTIAANYATSWGCNAVCAGWFEWGPSSDAWDSLYVEKVSLWEPADTLTIEGVIELGMEHGVSPLIRTWSCIAPRLAGRGELQGPTGLAYKPCGKCNKCVDLERAFESLGLGDPPEYLACPTTT